MGQRFTILMKSALRAGLLTILMMLVMAFTPHYQSQETDFGTMQQFIDKTLPAAQESALETGVPVSVTFGQASLEQNFRGIRDRNTGENSYNYFGIKWHPAPVKNDRIAIGFVEATPSGTQDVVKWRKYKSAEDAFRDHGLFLRNYCDANFGDFAKPCSVKSIYSEAFKYSDAPDRFIEEVSKAGYGGSGTYANAVKARMKQYDFYRYDLKPDDARLVNATDFPVLDQGENFQIVIELRNVGMHTWRARESYYLQNVNNHSLGGPTCQDLPREIPPGNSVRCVWNVRAPDAALIYQSDWQMKHDDTAFGQKVSVHVVVVPPGATQLKKDLQRQVDEWRRAGQKEIEKLVAELFRRIQEYLRQEAERKAKEICSTPAMFLLVLALWFIWERHIY